MNKIEGMSWDLFHLLDALAEMAALMKDNRIFLQYIATADKTFSEIIDINPIERIFIYNDITIAKYKYSIRHYFPNDDYIMNMITDNMNQRQQVCKNVNLNKLSKSLENELLMIIESK
ncbi:MAG: hypothetical protein NC397_04210 [Clostridium sp.]|nr:hypothetical protein [Clostridium sp.]